MNFKISVIIPIYNAEKNLEKSIKSVIKQSIGFENIELILIDDNSKDKSRQIIKEYADKYNNIRPIYLKKNSGGASIPRNKGIQSSTAKYIMFMDSDDEYKPDICEKFYNTLVSENADIVSCNYYATDDIHTSKINFDSQIETEKGILTDESIIEFDNVYVWNKLFKKSIIIENNILFKESISEDFIFCMEYLIQCTKRAYLKDYYGYIKYIQKDSLSIKGISLTTVYNHVNVNFMISELIKKYVNDSSKIKKINNKVFKDPIKWIIEELVTVPRKDVKEGLYKLYSFEKEIEFEENLDNILLNTINKLILKKKWNAALIILKIGKIFLNSTITRKIYRMLS